MNFSPYTTQFGIQANSVNQFAAAKLVQNIATANGQVIFFLVFVFFHYFFFLIVYLSSRLIGNIDLIIFQYLVKYIVTKTTMNNFH